MIDDEVCRIYTQEEVAAIEAQMNVYLMARDELYSTKACAQQSNWFCAKNRATVILRRTMELELLEAEQAAGMDRKEIINMTMNIIATLKAQA